VVEPSVQYAYSSSDRVALAGYTVIPTITIGLINLQEAKSNTFTGTLSIRYGLTNRWEIEVRAPYVYRNDQYVGLPLNTGTSTGAPQVGQAIGSHIGDIEATTRYQFNAGGSDTPYYVGSLRFKSRTGIDPFDVQNLQSGSFNGVVEQRTLPTGSGFYAIQAGLSTLLPADPAVLFGGVSYLYNFKRASVAENTDAGPVLLQNVAAGDIITLNLGVGLALSERTSISLGYEHSSVGATRIDGATSPGATRIELGTLALGVSYRRTNSTTVITTLGVGVTRDTPDISITLRVPTTL
jgi:hypothetical protein